MLGCCKGGGRCGSKKGDVGVLFRMLDRCEGGASEVLGICDNGEQGPQKKSLHQDPGFLRSATVNIYKNLCSVCEKDSCASKGNQLCHIHPY